MKDAISRPGRSALPLALAAVASGLMPASTAADPGRGAGCIAPDVVGVTLAQARQVLSASGCGMSTRQLPAHGQFYVPASADPRQLVGSQRPKAGTRTGSVTISLKPLCQQPAAPGPDTRGVSMSKGPTELVSGLYVAGGPLMLSSSCRHGRTSAGVLTITSPDGRLVSQRSVRAGRYGIFPLKPGRYMLSGTFAGPGNRPTEPVPLTIAAHRTTHLDVVTDVP